MGRHRRIDLRHRRGLALFLAAIRPLDAAQFGRLAGGRHGPDRDLAAGRYLDEARLRRWLGLRDPSRQAGPADARRLLFRAHRRRVLAWSLLTWVSQRTTHEPTG